MSALENQVTKIAQPLHPASNMEAGGRISSKILVCCFWSTSSKIVQ